MNKAPSGLYFHPTPMVSHEIFQNKLLQGVSRTFALTIPQLPPSLGFVISNAYLLCRTIDTIEDESNLTRQEKAQYSAHFVNVIKGEADAEEFSTTLYPKLSDQTIAAEKELVAHIPRIIHIFGSLRETQRKALARCVEIMAKGMVYFQGRSTRTGLENLKEHDTYCYHVAGVVGEMLTDLFCQYSPSLGKNRAEMMALAPSFGQGLQMTNILKDVWEDYARNVCWLPRDIFHALGIQLDQLPELQGSPDLSKGLEHMIGLAHGHLERALEYTLLIPTRETGIRKFCLWAIGMAVLTLKRIHHNQAYRSGSDVKISRAQVKGTILMSNLLVRTNKPLELLFNLTRAGLPLRQV